MKKTRKEKKRLFVISAVIILLIVSLVSSVAGDWTKIMENKSKIQKLNKKYNELLNYKMMIIYLGMQKKSFCILKMEN